MRESINKELIKLRLKLQCGKVLFTIISILLSIVLTPIILALYAACLIFMTVIVVCYCVALPFIVAYNCITYKYEFEDMDKEYQEV